MKIGDKVRLSKLAAPAGNGVPDNWTNLRGKRMVVVGESNLPGGFYVTDRGQAHPFMHGGTNINLAIEEVLSGTSAIVFDNEVEVVS